MSEPRASTPNPRAARARPDPIAVAARNATFRAEAEAFGLLFRCTDCAHVVSATSRCSLGYPNDHLLHSDNAVEDDGEFMFCKYFEAGE